MLCVEELTFFMFSNVLGKGVKYECLGLHGVRPGSGQASSLGQSTLRLTGEGH